MASRGWSGSARIEQTWVGVKTFFSAKNGMHEPHMRAVTAVIPVLTHYWQVLPYDIGRAACLTEQRVLYERDRRMGFGGVIVH